MRIIEKNANGYNFKFVCESRNTRNGFAHDCTLFINGNEYEKVSCFYLNRTWEEYQYQTVCKKAIDNEAEWKTARLKSIYKAENHLCRISARAQAELEQIYADDEFLTACREVRAEL